MDEIQRVIVLLIASAVVTVGAQRIRVSYTLALLLLGLILGGLHVAPFLTLQSDVILLVFLPPLLFEAAFVLDLDLLWKTRRGVLLLAFVGVGLATLVSGLVAYGLLPIPWTIAILFGAIVAATDPVAVLSVLRQLGVSDRLAVLLEGESLFNDGIGLVLFITLSNAVTGGLVFDSAVLHFAWSIVGGAIIGVLVGFVGMALLVHTVDTLTEALVSVAAAYGAFMLADGATASGVLATLAAGMVLGRAARRHSTLLTHGYGSLVDLWEFLAFLANAALFLEMGVTIKFSDFQSQGAAVASGIVAALIGRAVVSYGLGPLINFLGMPISVRESHVLFWGGLRGAVALAAVLSLPESFPHHDELLAMTYGTVLFTLFAQGLTISPLVRKLGLQQPTTTLDAGVDVESAAPTPP